ncbi:ubiquitin carboxyl-terminal hydrolase isozyme L3 [Onthophagus taurus]|uniref:ubiquitin carboxyl-terminal hydrolase isozyme L3 n=1 Tax=Onthophagus taurus TaxID=166361 RepID=UPI000C201D1F|nr:ubiquitin carboxyl-terminal hydrolase isozyme L3 [Onthophagus taurus]
MAWFPLESNPDVMNKFMQKLGVPDKWNIVDVYGLESEALAWVPKPVLAVILLFPYSEKHHNYATEQNERLKVSGQDVSPNVYFLKQVVSNACGTIALVHSVANNCDRIELAEGKFKELLSVSKNMSPEDRGTLLQSVAGQIMNVHQELAQEGQTELNPNESVNHHFVAFVEKEGNLYELDGRKEFPINHGPSSPETLLEDAAKICKEFMTRDAEDVNFTVLALTAQEA